MNIDWSKAPEGATHARNCGWEHADWYKIVDGVLLVHSCGEGWDESGYSVMDEIPNLHTRPSTEWTGTGLPPVGTVCEYYIDDDKWRQCEIVAHKDGYAVIWITAAHVFSARSSGLLRPIRTQEQIEADERKAALEEMFQVSYAGDIWHILGSLYDAGYRKQPKEGA